MSDDVLSVIPTDPYWQPDQAAADRATALVTALSPGLPDGVDVEIDVGWYGEPAAVPCGQNLERIGCPHCGASIGLRLWEDLLEVHGDGGFPTLAVQVPCCRAETSLDALDYDWPCGFARFEIAVWNPERTSFNDDELALLATALGHPVRQIQAHI
ncbi:hypothetical protein ACFY4C_01765 [Actinomadura viridis]|uniref:hypothetical protein n=1 Tax=Actinomadura viridis TaxID=58110 RepID=UPI003692D706